jgi:hypothetical protein
MSDRCPNAQVQEPAGGNGPAAGGGGSGAAAGGSGGGAAGDVSAVTEAALQMLASMGFQDRPRNEALLRRFIIEEKYNIIQRNMI